MPRLPRVSPEQVRLINRAHTAAMKVLHGRAGVKAEHRAAIEHDGELLLSYVVWPTEAITRALEAAAA